MRVQERLLYKLFQRINEAKIVRVNIWLNRRYTRIRDEYNRLGKLVFHYIHIYVYFQVYINIIFETRLRFSKFARSKITEIVRAYE